VIETRGVEADAAETNEKEKEARVEMFTKQQQLINQYMHLNIQLLSRKLENLEQIEKLPREEQPDAQPDLKSSKKKMYYSPHAAKKRTTAATLTRNTTRRECAATATTNTGATRSHGTAHMTSFTPTACAKTATSTATTANAGRSVTKRLTPMTSIASSRKNSAHDHFHPILSSTTHSSISSVPESQ
jgi:DNA-binding protein H-NS